MQPSLSAFRTVQIFLLAACLALGVSCKEENKAVQAAREQSVTVLVVEPSDVPLTADLPARVNAYRKAEVRPQVDGIIVDRLFTEGALVEEGQSLYKIDPQVYQAAFDSAQANLESAKAKLAAAQLKRNRRRSLRQAQAVSEQEWEDANAEYLQALANASLAKAQLRTAEIRLRYTDVLAPISGRIGKSSCTQGSLVTANQPDELAVIQQLDPVYVDMTQSALNLLKIRERYSKGSLARPAGASAKVQALLETGAVYEAEGELKFSDITVDQGTGMVLLRAVFPNPDGVLLPGMYVRARVSVGVQKNALLVPQLAVRRNAKGVGSVFVATAGNEAEERIVEAKERAGGFWIVSSGLKAGEKVVISSLQNVRHGTRLKIDEVKTLQSLRDDAKSRQDAGDVPGLTSAGGQR